MAALLFLAASEVELSPLTPTRARDSLEASTWTAARTASAAAPATPLPGAANRPFEDLPRTTRSALAEVASELALRARNEDGKRQRLAGSEAPQRTREERASARRIELLAAASLLAPSGPSFQVAGVEHTPYRVTKHGLPFFNRRGRIHRQDGVVRGVAGGVSFPPILRRGFELSREDAVGLARSLAGVVSLRAAPRSERGWYAADGGSRPAWRIDLPSRVPLASWQVTLDAETGEVLSLVDRLLTLDGTGTVYHPNVREAKGVTSVALRDLDGTGNLAGTYARVYDERDIEAFSSQLEFDFPTDDPRFVQTAVYRGLTETAHFAVQNGFPSFDEPIVTFTNMGDGTGGEMNNAFYDPSLPAFGFGDGDGTTLANLGTDLDVAAHEMGHHIFETLVAPEIVDSRDPVVAMHEGVADTFSMLIGGDLDVGESTVPGKKFLRTLKGRARYPEAYDPDPHETGRVYGGANADLHKKLKEDFLPTFFAALPFLPPDPVESDYREAFMQADASVNNGLYAETIRKIFKKRGFEALEDPEGFEGVLEPGVPEARSIGDGKVHIYSFFEFPGSTRLAFSTTGTGDVDLLVAPMEIFDSDDPATYGFSSGLSSTEALVFRQNTVPSVDAGDSWLVAVLDYPDDASSTYTLNLDETLPMEGVVIDGPAAVGDILEAGEIDFYLFNGSMGDRVRLEVNAQGPDLDVLAAILTVDDFELLGIDDDGGPGTDVLIQGAELTTDGPFAVAVLSPLADLDPTVGTGTYTVGLSTCTNVGADTDGDLISDVCDDDDDGDGFIDGSDTGPLDPALCADVDDDGCDDCIMGSFDYLNDGPDIEGDGLCDTGDPDDDNDGCPDVDDPAPLVTSGDPDFDFLGADCDNCLEVPNPAQVDTNVDGQGDACSSCTRVEWSEPPLFPPDQNPAESRIALKGLDKEVASLKASGVFGLPHALAPIDPLTSGVFLRLADSAGQLLELNLPGGAPGSSICGEKDGWTAKPKGTTTTYTYKNASDALPAAGCALGSAGGKASVKIVSTPTEISYRVSFKALSLDRPLEEPVTFLQLDLVMGEQAATGVGGAAGDAGLCSETVLRMGDPTASCKVSAKNELLKAVACKRP
jgi:hypothetical protein